MALRALIELRLSNETERRPHPNVSANRTKAYCGIKGWDIVHIWLMREQTAENRRAAQAVLRAQMLYGGGPISYGDEKYKDGAHWPLRPCPAEPDHGRSCDSLTVEMNRKGILTKRGHRWPKGAFSRNPAFPVLRGVVL